jgi:ABC-2 type transport system ATP-binding protein
MIAATVADTGGQTRHGGPGGSAASAVWGVRDLSVRFGAKQVLTGVTLAVPAGTITAVVGGDGAGKSTLLRALAGRVRPDAGAVDSPGRASIGFVSAEGGAYRDLTVDENLAFVGGAYGVPAAEQRERSQQLLERTGLLEARSRLGGQLSGGMRQKLAVAMALLHRPPLLILDEPTTGIDPVSRNELWRLIAATAAAGAAVLLSSTYIDEAERAAAVCVLDRGVVLLQGPPDAVVDTVRDHIYVLPVDVPRPPTGCWRRGATWRLYAAAGAPAGATPVAADLNDAVIAAALRLTSATRPREAA